MAKHWGKRRVNGELLARLIEAKPTKPEMLAKNAGIGKTKMYAMLRGEEVGFELIEKVIAALGGVVTPLGEKAEDLLTPPQNDTDANSNGRFEPKTDQACDPGKKPESACNAATEQFKTSIIVSGIVVDAKERKEIRLAMSEAASLFDRFKVRDTDSSVSFVSQNNNEDDSEAEAGRVIELLRGMHEGEFFWCFLAIKPSKYKKFIELVVYDAYHALLLNFDSTGEILCWDYGFFPPASVVSEVSGLYNIDSSAFYSIDPKDPLDNAENVLEELARKRLSFGCKAGVEEACSQVVTFPLPSKEVNSDSYLPSQPSFEEGSYSAIAHQVDSELEIDAFNISINAIHSCALNDSTFSETGTTGLACQQDYIIQEDCAMLNAKMLDKTKRYREHQ